MTPKKITVFFHNASIPTHNIDTCQLYNNKKCTQANY